MPNVTIEVRTTCPTCGGVGEGQWVTPWGLNQGGRCVTCHGTGTVVDAERSQWLRTVAEWAASQRCMLTGEHAEADCPHELAKAVIA